MIMIKNTVLPFQVLILSTFVINTTNAFTKSPVKQVVLVRALHTTVTEAIALNVFDQSSLYKEVFCNCNNYPQVLMYASGFVIFSYIAIKNSYTENKIKDINFYKKSKRYFRILLFMIIIFFNKDVQYAF